ncbi:hypothetical protein ACFPZI_37175 [Streptomyces chlorus]|uniref:Uncharacterized protein n=1 Tax=Streptomyces chlorus TaxID=887452 RepID=A0ABW1E9L0_9ACTN
MLAQVHQTDERALVRRELAAAVTLASEDTKYSISGGELNIRKTGKTSWADSRFKEKYVADDDQTRRFLRSFLHVLDTDGIE